MPRSEVPRIELNKNGTITATAIPNFDEGTPIEISGQATQAMGSVTFYSVQIMPRHGTQDKPSVRSVRQYR
jgi:hypothetical protein